MSLLGLLLFELLMTGLGSALIYWALIDVRRGFNFSCSPVLIKDRLTDCLTRDEAPFHFWYAVSLKAGLGLLTFGIAIHVAVIWLPKIW